MAHPPRSSTSLSGGFLIAVGIMVGVIYGTWKGQPTIGFLIGLAVGVVLAVAVWQVDKMRRG